MAETKHTAGEMGVNFRRFPPGIGIVGCGTIAVVAGEGSDEEDKANAARLALAWNAHDELVTAAKAVLYMHKNPPPDPLQMFLALDAVATVARAALDKATAPVTTTERT